MKKNEYSLENLHNYNIDEKNRTIFLSSEGETAGEENGIDYEVTIKFQKNLYLLNSINHEPITIHMLCIGGDTDYGMGIYDLIKSSPSKITIIANSYCCSMATIILQSASNRIIMPNIEFMVHYGRITSQNGDLALIQNNYDYWTRKNKTMLDIYAERCKDSQFYKEHKMNHDKMVKFLDKKLKENHDWTLTAEEVIYYGFADKIYS